MEQLSSYAARGYSAYANPYTFTGRRLDVLDGGGLLIMHYRHRDYRPDLGRFMQEDPLGYVDGLSLYQYVMSRPVNGLDPFGNTLTEIGDENPELPPFTIPITTPPGIDDGLTVNPGTTPVVDPLVEEIYTTEPLIPTEQLLIPEQIQEAIKCTTTWPIFVYDTHLPPRECSPEDDCYTCLSKLEQHADIYAQRLLEWEADKQGFRLDPTNHYDDIKNHHDLLVHHMNATLECLTLARDKCSGLPIPMPVEKPVLKPVPALKPEWVRPVPSYRPNVQYYFRPGMPMPTAPFGETIQEHPELLLIPLIPSAVRGIRGIGGFGGARHCKDCVWDPIGM